MSLPQATLKQRENDRIDMATNFRVVVELEVENLDEEWAREVYVWHRINDAKNPCACGPEVFNHPSAGVCEGVTAA